MSALRIRFHPDVVETMAGLLSSLLVVVLVLNFYVLGTGRIRAVIQTVALQGVLLGTMPLLVHDGPRATVLSCGNRRLKSKSARTLSHPVPLELGGAPCTRATPTGPEESINCRLTICPPLRKRKQDVMLYYTILYCCF